MMGFIPSEFARTFRLEDALPDFHYELADFEVDLWANRGQIAQNIRMAGADKEIFPTVAAARQDALQWIFEGLADGYTAIFNKLNLCNADVARLCQEINRAYPDGARTFVTAFLSPSSQHCFGYHYDEVDVFLVQVHGVKSWSVARPSTPFPIEGMYKPPVDQDQCAREYLRTDLSPGDVLYIPRGHIHRGLPGQAGSLHLSAGVHVPTIADGIVQAVRKASLLQEALRLPATAGERDELIRQALETLEANSGLDADLAEKRIYLPRDGLRSMLRVGRLVAEDLLVRVNGVPITYKLMRDLSTLEVSGLLFDYGVRSEQRSKTAFPSGYYRAMQLINEKCEFTPREIAQELGLPIEDAIELGRRLITLGVLEYKAC
ncbi:JmjC domain-containing protein [Methylibium rhizosphaerae]|uniref:JmjC domain-containing protein n=1 Tax=Methylibium rhizosphaerae TaxID=2570323 RepID=UPI00112A48AC|nr:cupin domain-containing protein [Methylibium rhizosphaerae]